jgi:hypothetical protein
MKSAASLLLSLVVWFNPCRGDHITVSGNVSGVWRADTVFVAGEVRVPPGQELVIRPGVRVIFLANYKLIVDSSAVLRAEGLPGDLIYFTAGNIAIGWHGIRFLHADDASILRYCHLEYGKSSSPLWGDPDGFGGAAYCFYSNLPSSIVP